MKDNRVPRYIIIAVILIAGAIWSFSLAAQKESTYPNGELITNAQWLKGHLKNEDLVIADVRTDEYFDNGLIPGAVRMI